MMVLSVNAEPKLTRIKASQTEFGSDAVYIDPDRLGSGA